MLTTTQLNSLQARQLEQLSDQEFWEYASRLAAVASTPETSPETFLECVLAHDHCILPLNILCQILPAPTLITHFPAAPRWMIGVTNWRGETIPVIDLNAYLTQQAAHLSSDQMLLIMRDEDADITLGLLAGVYAVLPPLQPTQLQPAEGAWRRYLHASPRAIVGVYNEAFLLDIHVILADMVQQIKNDNYV